jgi:hypothetical protein
MCVQVAGREIKSSPGVPVNPLELADASVREPWRTPLASAEAQMHSPRGMWMGYLRGR